MKSAATRPAALAAIAALLVLALAGCAGSDSIRLQTQDFYTAGDGVNAQAGDLGIRNLLLVATETGGDGQTPVPATVLATFANPTTEPDRLLEVRVGESSAQPDGGGLEIPARGYASLGVEDDRLQIEGDGIIPGRFVLVTLVFEQAPETTVRALVALGEGVYADAAPTEQPITGFGTTATPTPSPTTTP
ncbi:MAG TPA: hypothetical protein VK894_00015 [Jiangellales bacterium]|nr:hypothetical protein [Jiangellales bacterium]